MRCLWCKCRFRIQQCLLQMQCRLFAAKRGVQSLRCGVLQINVGGCCVRSLSAWLLVCSLRGHLSQDMHGLWSGLHITARKQFCLQLRALDAILTCGRILSHVSGCSAVHICHVLIASAGKIQDGYIQSEHRWLQLRCGSGGRGTHINCRQHWLSTLCWHCGRREAAFG